MMFTALTCFTLLDATFTLLDPAFTLARFCPDLTLLNTALLNAALLLLCSTFTLLDPALLFH